MNKIKIFLMITIIVLLSGCNAVSNVTMDYNGKVKEEVTLTDSSYKLGDDKSEITSNIKIYHNQYRKVLNNKGYNYSYIIDEENSGSKLINQYDNICSYFQNTIFNQYVFKHIDCSETDEYYLIENDTDYITYCADCPDWPALDDVTLNIKLPISAIENNADLVDNNTYTWKFDKNTESSKGIYLKIDKKSLKLSEEKHKQEVIKNNKKSLALKVIVVVIVISILILTIISLFKKYKKNKLDY